MALSRVFCETALFVNKRHTERIDEISITPYNREYKTIERILNMGYKLLQYDKTLRPYTKDIALRMANYARKKQEYKAKFRGQERADWKNIQAEWMKYCLMLKYRDNALFRKDLFACHGKQPVEDATLTNYDSNLFWGAKLIDFKGKKYYFGCNVLGKLLSQLHTNNGKLNYELPENMHLFGKPILDLQM